jgi:hypothetical protein
MIVYSFSTYYLGSQAHKGVLALRTYCRNWWRWQQRALWSFPMEDSIEENYFWLLDESCNPPHDSRLFDLPVEDDGIHF